MFAFLSRLCIVLSIFLFWCAFPLALFLAKLAENRFYFFFRFSQLFSQANEPQLIHETQTMRTFQNEQTTNNQRGRDARIQNGKSGDESGPADCIH